MVRIVEVSLTPQTTTVGASVSISVKVSENDWYHIKETYGTWQAIKDTFSSWLGLKNW